MRNALLIFVQERPLHQMDFKYLAMDWNVYMIIQKPAYQALFCFLLTLTLILVIKPKSADTAWLIAFYSYVLFLLINALVFWLVANQWHYFFYSIGYAVVFVLIVTLVMQVLLKTLKLESSQESAMAFLVIIYQPFVLLAMMFLKWVINTCFY